MAKITLTLTLDVPKADQFSDAELSQCIFDTVVNYVTLAHLKDGMNWIVQEGKAAEIAPDCTESYAEGCRRLRGHHNLWAEITGAAQHTMTITREP